ncbi:forkhead box protein C1-like isoform X1 [Hemicordylus capensis]|uniref:forkhead box protein C1-like isoform X1 n=1 Tax=Hemicordylus capensis TaxID=884348 RepID=UPI0023044391|nr:forkhead box protein C1-like isoform X1 [Hemicordylus capensis]
MLNEETSMPGSVPGPRIHIDILEGELNEATSVPGSLPASHDVPEGPAACLCPPGSGSSLSSASLEVGSIPPSTSTSSFLLHPSSPPPPSPHPLELELSNVKETLQSLMDLQFHQLNDRQRHLRICQECLQNLKALRGDLRRLQSRLASVEATIGILVPPRELDVEEEKEEDKNQTVLHP